MTARDAANALRRAGWTGTYRDGAMVWTHPDLGREVDTKEAIRLQRQRESAEVRTT